MKFREPGIYVDEIVLGGVWTPNQNARQERLSSMANTMIDLGSRIANPQKRKRLIALGGVAEDLIAPVRSLPGSDFTLASDFALDAAFVAFSDATNAALEAGGGVSGSVIRRLIAALNTMRRAVQAAQFTRSRRPLRRLRTALSRARAALLRLLARNMGSAQRLDTSPLERRLVSTLTAAPTAPPRLFQF